MSYLTRGYHFHEVRNVKIQIEAANIDFFFCHFSKFLMRVWRELLEYQRKQKQRGLKLSKGKKLK